MAIEKVGTLHVVLSFEGVTLNNPRDFPGVVNEDGPRFPARLLEGPWTAFHTANPAYGGDNGVLWHDATACDFVGFHRGDAEMKTGTQMDRERGVVAHLYSYINLTGTFAVTVDVYDAMKLPTLVDFFKAVDAGFRLGNRKTVGGVCRVVSDFEWTDASGTVQFDGWLNPPVVEGAYKKGRPAYRCEAGHRQPAQIRKNGGVCARCGAEVLPEWMHTYHATISGEARQYGSRVPMMDSVEVILRRDLSLELPRDPMRRYQPDPAFPAIEGGIDINQRALHREGLPQFPWKWAGLKTWRSRLDVLAGMAVVFISQGADMRKAITCAAVVHRLLTGFRLTPENSGTWALLVDEGTAKYLYEQLLELIEIAKGEISFQQITAYAAFLAGISLAPTEESGEPVEGGEEDSNVL